MSEQLNFGCPQNILDGDVVTLEVNTTAGRVTLGPFAVDRGGDADQVELYTLPRGPCFSGDRVHSIFDGHVLILGEDQPIDLSGLKRVRGRMSSKLRAQVGTNVNRTNQNGALLPEDAASQDGSAMLTSP
jgi:hypothetical protein